ncbi:MAG: hypothetical protein K9K79_01955 [Desulfohalobiaceae bacterium]|nr:hypothetical protein [Desulfohalobiaceae bacterium]
MKKDSFEELTVLPGDEPWVQKNQWSRNGKYLLNKLNYLHFEDKSFYLHFRHKKFDRILTLEVKSEPCARRRLRCFWVSDSASRHELQNYEFESLSFQVKEGWSIVAYAGLARLDEQGAVLELPEKCLELASEGKEQPCEEIEVLLYQTGVVLQGWLESFSPKRFQICLQVEPSQSFKWITFQNPVHLVLKDREHTYYSGDCILRDQARGHEVRHFALEPVQDEIQRFKPREYRSSRTVLVPSPLVSFRHPLTGKKLLLKTTDISGVGLAVEDNSEGSSLFAGLIIPEVKIYLHADRWLTCSVQVIHQRGRGPGKDDAAGSIFGLCFLDMDLQEHAALCSLLQQARDTRASLDGPLDMDELWNFFFETGFVYPQKYLHLQQNKEELKETYQKVYANNSPLAKYFLYRERGAIRAHMSMLRFYNRAWLIHHHAADSRQGRTGGARVLSQISRYVNEIYTLDSARMDYVFCYFRPENKFPERVFGGFAKYLRDPGKCSRDTFAYVFKEKLAVANSLPDDWTLRRVSNDDLLDFSAFYQELSGGLLFRAFDFQARGRLDQDLVTAYQRMGFDRENLMFSLQHKGELKVLVLISRSAPGLNMSDLTNCIKLFIVDKHGLNRRIFWTMITALESRIKDSKMPLLVYPLDSLKEVGLDYDKLYSLWISDLEYLDDYFAYGNKLFKTL